MQALLLVVLTLLQHYIFAALSPPLTVETSNGPITGHSASNRSAVIEYLGIPYVQPPLGAFRFAPPEKYSGRSAYVAANWVRCPTDYVVLDLDLIYYY